MTGPEHDGKAVAARTATCATTGLRLSLRALGDINGIATGWSALGRRALTPNIFYEPEYAVPAAIPFGDGVQLLGLSAEVTSPYANSVTAALGERTLTLGYCNGMLCYVASAMQQEDGGYEVDDAPYWFGLPGRFTSDLEPILTTALLDLGRA